MFIPIVTLFCTIFGMPIATCVRARFIPSEEKRY